MALDAPLCPRNDSRVTSDQIDSVPVQSMDPHVAYAIPLLPRLPPRYVELPDVDPAATIVANNDEPAIQDTGLHVNYGQGPSTELNPNATLFVSSSGSLRITSSQS